MYLRGVLGAEKVIPTPESPSEMGFRIWMDGATEGSQT